MIEKKLKSKAKDRGDEYIPVVLLDDAIQVLREKHRVVDQLLYIDIYGVMILSGSKIINS